MRTNTYQIKRVAEIIGDALFEIESGMIMRSRGQCEQDQIKDIMDRYAEEFDEILKKHGVDMGNELRKCVISLLSDLERIEDQEIKDITQD